MTRELEGPERHLLRVALSFRRAVRSEPGGTTPLLTGGTSLAEAPFVFKTVEQFAPEPAREARRHLAARGGSGLPLPAFLLVQQVERFSVVDLCAADPFTGGRSVLACRWVCVGRSWHPAPGYVLLEPDPTGEDLVARAHQLELSPYPFEGHVRTISDGAADCLAVVGLMLRCAVRREAAREPATKKQRLGREPCTGTAYSVVWLGEARTGASRPGGGGTHASPRRHDRMGHYRRCGERVVWVRPHKVGRAELGSVVHDYGARPTAPAVRAGRDAGA